MSRITRQNYKHEPLAAFVIEIPNGRPKPPLKSQISGVKEKEGFPGKRSDISWNEATGRGKNLSQTRPANNSPRTLSIVSVDTNRIIVNAAPEEDLSLSERHYGFSLANFI